MKNKQTILHLSACAAFSLHVSAATLIWNNGASNMQWDATSTNWGGGTTWNNATPDQATFGATGIGTVTLTTGITANAITFDNAGYTIAGNTLTLSGTTPTITANADATISSIISGSSLTKSGSGTLTLSGSNTYGSTTVNAGKLLVSGATGALGTGTITVGVNGTLEFAATTGGRTISNNLVGAGAILKNGSGTDRYNFSGDNSGFSGTYTQSGAQTKFTIATAGSAGANWVFNGTYFISQIGTATLNFGALTGSAAHWNDSTSGTTTLEVGALNSDTTFSGALGGTSGAITALTKVGAGTLTLTNTNTYTGGTTVTNGTLALNYSSGGEGCIRGVLTIESGGIVTTNGYNSFGYNAGQQVTAVNLNGGSLTTGSPADLTLNGTAVAFSGGGTIQVASGNINLMGGAGVSASNTSATATIGGTSVLLRQTNTNFTVAAGSADSGLTISAPVGNYSGSVGGITKAGAGVMTLAANNTYTGATTISGGKLTIGSGGSINETSGVSIGAGELNYNSTTALTKTITFSTTGGTLSGSGTINNAVIVTSNNIQTAGSSVKLGQATATLGTQTFSTSIDYQAGSIFEWNLTANATDIVGTRGLAYDAVNTGSLLNTGGSDAIFRVVLDSSQNFSEAFWNATRTWSDIFQNGSTALDIQSIFGTGSTVQCYNSGGQLFNVAAQGSFSISGTNLTWTAVPEPSSALAGLLLGAGLLRRRRA